MDGRRSASRNRDRRGSSSPSVRALALVAVVAVVGGAAACGCNALTGVDRFYTVATDDVGPGSMAGDAAVDGPRPDAEDIHDGKGPSDVVADATSDSGGDAAPDATTDVPADVIGRPTDSGSNAGGDAATDATVDTFDGCVRNPCGGCTVLGGAMKGKGDPCGSCGGVLVCAGPDALVCSKLSNECGGCSELTHKVGVSCDECGGLYGCLGTEVVVCNRKCAAGAFCCASTGTCKLVGEFCP